MFKSFAYSSTLATPAILAGTGVRSSIDVQEVTCCYRTEMIWQNMLLYVQETLTTFAVSCEAVNRV